MAWPLDYPLPLAVLLFLIILPPALLLPRRRKIAASNGQLTPRPPGWPIFGNMFQLGPTPHRTLTGLMDQYAPVIWLRIGAINTMAILSAKAATEFFKNHDFTFADRTVTETMRVHNYHKSSLAIAPYGSYWRVMRRLVTVDMLINKRINDSACVRRRCVDDMLVWIAKEESKQREKGRGIHVARFVFLTSFNLLGNLMLSRDLFAPESEEGSDFFTGMMGWTGHANVADLFRGWTRKDSVEK